MLVSFSWLFGCRAGKPGHPTAEGALQRLGIYYGWPSAFDGAASVEQAVAGLGIYQVVVLGAGLQQPGHGDHANTRAVVRALGDRGAQVYGYVPLGSATGLDLATIEQQVKAWRAVGVAGIFYDEAGYDFGNTRARQNAAFAAAHAKKLRVFANAFAPDDLFARERSPQNPGGAGTRLRAGDSYLYESFGLIRGQPEEEGFRRSKVARLEAARALGLQILGVTTSPSAGFFDGPAWERVIGLARSCRLHGLGWGEYHFAAGDNVMPPRPWPQQR